MQTRYKGIKEETKTVQDTNITTGQQEKLNLPDLITQQSHNKWNQKYARYKVTNGQQGKVKARKILTYPKWI